MSLMTTDLRAAADRLIAAAAESLQCNPVRDILGDNNIASAYEVRRDAPSSVTSAAWSCQRLQR